MRGVSVPIAPTDIYTSSLFGSTVIKTLVPAPLVPAPLVPAPMPFHANGGDGFILKVGNSGRTIAKNLRTMALVRMRPVLLQYVGPVEHCYFRVGRYRGQHGLTRGAAGGTGTEEVQ
jgi:hypothetical protein